MTLSHAYVGPGASAGRARSAIIDTVVTALVAGYRVFANRRSAARLADLDDRMLEDIGLSRADLRIALSQPVWSDPTADLAALARPRGRRFN